MLRFVLAFVAGVCFCQQLARLWPLSALLSACTVALLLFVAAARFEPTHRRIASRIFLWILAACMGLCWATWRADLRLADALDLELEGRDVAITGYVADLPDRTPLGLHFVFRVQSTRPGVPDRISLSWYAGPDSLNRMPPLRAGERWQFTVRLHRPHGSLNPYGFDYEAWMFERDIRATGYVRSQSPAVRLDGLAAGIDPAIQRMRQIVRERFERVLPEGRWTGVLSALAVGDQSAVTTQQWKLFSRTGVTHLMSISGSHVTLFAALIAWLVRHAWGRAPALALRLPAQKAALAAGACAALAYVLLSGFGVPAQRTLYMLLAAVAGLWLGRNADAWRSLAAGLLFVVLYDPWAGLSPGFWLSFGAVAVLMWIALSANVKERGIGAWLRTQWRAQWAIILLSLPLLLILFQQFSLVSPFANAIAIPVISVLVTPLALLFSVVPLPSIAELAHALLTVLMHGLEWLAALPFANWQQAAPPLWLVMMTLLAVFWALLPRGIPGRHVALLAVLPMLSWMPQRPAAGRFDTTVVDVGQGLAVHVQTAGHDLLFDTGPRYTPESDSGERVIQPYLRAIGVTRLDRMVVSHDDSDHSGGAESMLDLMAVGELWGSLPADSPIVAHAGRLHPCIRGETWSWDGVRFEFLHPSAGTQSSRDNDRSCVLRVSSETFSLLLTADIEAGAEDELLRRDAARLRSDAMVAPHHGSKTSSQAGFIDAVGARTVIFTTGYRNRFGHPHPDVVARYEASGARLLRSDRDGAVIVHDTPAGAQFAWERQRAARYWHGQ